MMFITLIYPLAVWLGQGQLEPRFLAGLLVLAGLTRVHMLKISQRERWWLGGGALTKSSGRAARACSLTIAIS